MKYRKSIEIQYKYANAPESEQAVEEVFDWLIRKILHNRREVKKILQSEAFLDLYKRIKKRRSLLSDFIRYS